MSQKLYSNKSSSNFTVIEIPPYLTSWELNDQLTRTLRILKTPFEPCYIDMAKVKNVYVATVRLLIRIYEKANRMNCPLSIINASEPVCSALSTLEIPDKIPVFPTLKDAHNKNKKACSLKLFASAYVTNV